MLIVLALGSLAFMATYDYGNEYVPYNAIDYTNTDKTGKNKTDKNSSEKKSTDNKNPNKTNKSSSENNSNADNKAQKSQPSADGTKLDPILKMQLELAVVSAKASAQCDYSSLGGYRNLKPEAAAKELVILMSSSNQSVSGEMQSSESNVPSPVMYVLDTASAPWQVVIRGDTENNILIIDGYGTGLSQPVFSETISCQ